MLKITQLKLDAYTDPKEVKDLIYKKLSGMLGIPRDEIRDPIILKRSLDARKKPDLFYNYSVAFSCMNEERILNLCKKKKQLLDKISVYDEKEYVFPFKAKDINSKNMSNTLGTERNDNDRPVIIGSGPAGLFCGLFLARAGFKPIILERGKCVEERSVLVEKFWSEGILDSNCNVQFGEGGAGTFSDGKLNTLIKDPLGLGRAVLKTFTEFGAPEKILYDHKPHIGTDILKDVVRNIRNEIIRLGGEVRFDSLVSGIITDGYELKGLAVNGEEIKCKRAVLAIGHSARDTFKSLYESKVHMEQKPFSVGFRVMHSQKMINLSQYGTESPGLLGAADYKLTAKTDRNRGVFSFCMCPGGYVVNASSEKGMTAVNGMSYSGRDGEDANSAIIITVGPEDYPSDHPLAGIEFQRDLEKRAYELGKGDIPIERYGDFRNKVRKLTPEDEGYLFCEEDKATIRPQIKGRYKYADLTSLLTEEMNECFVQGMDHFDHVIKGFGAADALMAGIESRTSSPVRINRDEDYQCNIKGLFPCGEGAGYAGGITSAAMDGIKVAENVAKNLLGV